MKFLKTEFEEQLSVKVDSEGNVIVGGIYYSPAQILQLDLFAYKEAYQGWLSDIWLPEQKEVLNQILQKHANEKRFEDLCDSVSRENVVPFVGSGMSVPMNLPTWGEFLRSIRRFSRLSEHELETLLADGKFEEAVDALCGKMPQNLFNERIEHDLRIVDNTKMNGPVQFLPSIFDGLILTTNLDNVLEELFRQNSCEFNHVLAGTNISDYRTLKAPNQSFLLKIHGDRSIRQGRVLNKNEYDETYGQKSVVREELTLILRTHNILFLGCSLGTDRTVQLIHEVAQNDANMPRHYAFLQSPIDDEPRLEREHFLTERGIYPIWFTEDHDSNIQALLVGILIKLGRDLTIL